MLNLLCAVLFRLAHFEVSRFPQRHIDVGNREYPAP